MAEGCGMVTAMRRLKVLRNVASKAALRVPPKHFFTSCNPRPAAAVTNQEGLVAAARVAESAAATCRNNTSPRKDMMMLKAVAMVLVLSLIGTAVRAEPTAEDKAACGADYKKYCSIVPEDRIQFIIECLKQNMSKLSDQCKKHMEKKQLSL